MPARVHAAVLVELNASLYQLVAYRAKAKRKAFSIPGSTLVVAEDRSAGMFAKLLADDLNDLGFSNVDDTFPPVLYFPRLENPLHPVAMIFHVLLPQHGKFGTGSSTGTDANADSDPHREVRLVEQLGFLLGRNVCNARGGWRRSVSTNRILCNEFLLRGEVECTLDGLDAGASTTGAPRLVRIKPLGDVMLLQF